MDPVLADVGEHQDLEELHDARLAGNPGLHAGALAAQSKKTIAGPIVSSVVSCSSSALIPK